MKFVLGAILCLCALAKVANAQIDTGTIVVVVTSKDKVAIAADSRATFSNGGHDDHHCKILALGNNLVFAATGTAVLSTPSLPSNLRFNILDELKFAYAAPRDSRFPEWGFTEGIFNGWWERIQVRFMEAIRWLQQNAPGELALIRGNMPQDKFVLGVLAGVEQSGELVTMAPSFRYGKIDNSFIHIDHDIPYVTGMPIPHPSDIMKEAAYGMNDVAKFYIYGQSAETQAERRSWEEIVAKNPKMGVGYVAVRITDLDIAFYRSPGSSFIGGPIDAVILKRGGGIDWVQRKDNCPERGD